MILTLILCHLGLNWTLFDILLIEHQMMDRIGDYWIFYPSSIETEQGYDVYADDKKIEHVQHDLSLFEILFEKDIKEITIARENSESTHP